MGSVDNSQALGFPSVQALIQRTLLAYKVRALLSYRQSKEETKPERSSLAAHPTQAHTLLGLLGGQCIKLTSPVFKSK